MPKVQRRVLKDTLIRDTEKAFRSAGWRIGTSNNFEVDMVVRKEEFAFFIQCVDKIILTYEDITSLINSYETSSRSMRFNRRETLIYITNFDLGDNEHLLERNIVAFNISEVGLILSVPDLLNHMQDKTDRRLAPLFGSKLTVILKIIDEYMRVENNDKALEWAIYAKTSFFSGYVEPYLRLIALYQQLQQYDRAEEAVREALRNQPQNITLLKKLTAILTKKGDFVAVAATQEKLSRSMARNKSVYKTSDDFVRFHSSTSIRQVDLNLPKKSLFKNILRKFILK